ncbi:uncharacterized protein LOC131680553 [Topomyia yanbarensis]|uniref:uncharacterized protein LOC131680553 n=1 Tax=Topomyia yanbarensis TaxID=2498891 RepID=UPI00273C3361|nr:uncharacterized protein LOC131680553 [Topomyia yanbarensis]
MKLSTDEGSVEIEISEGLPQGCPLSPILFNLYTTSLHDIMEEDCELIQFADDFAILVVGESMDNIEAKANRMLAKLNEGLTKLNLKTNASKSAGIVFSKRNTEGLRVRLGRETIQINNTHKYLGFILDRLLAYRKHIEYVREKGAEKLKIMKMLGNRNSNASPETLIKIENAIVRSKIEYGAQIYGSAAKSNIEKLQTIQNAALRTAMRYLKTTPINVIHAETGQLPVKERTEWLTIKDIAKSTYHTNQIQPFIEKAINLEKGNGSFLTSTAIKHNDIVSQIHPKDGTISWHNRRTYLGLDTVNTIKPNLFEGQKAKQELNPKVWQQHFLSVRNKYKNFNFLYTDASKTASGTAMAVFDETDNTVIRKKINGNYSTTNAELLAISKAVDVISEKNYKKAVIFTDSQGSCKMLLNNNIVQENFIAWQIIKSLKLTINKRILIQWIPSHQGIPGNERADKEAVITTSEPQNDFTALPLADVYTLAKNEIKESWTRTYQKLSEEKGKWHFEFMNEPGNKIWSHTLALSSEEKIILNRIRTGHTLTKERLYRWGWESDELCDICEETEDLQHILYFCTKYNNQRVNYPILEYCKPLRDILKENIESDLKEIVHYLKNINIHL